MRRIFMFSHIHVALFVGLFCLLLASCGSDMPPQYQSNPLGHDYLIQQYATPPPARTIPVSAATAKPTPHLRQVGLGTTPASFVTRYGQPLSISQPPTLYAFQVGLDKFPKGSVLIVSFDLGNDPTTPRALQISFVAGDAHPTTYAQAQAIIEGFLPDDTSPPVQINKQDPKRAICESKSYQSPALASLFPTQDFAGLNGNIAKPGSVVVSFYPHYPHYNDGTEDKIYGLDDPNIVSSVLVALGTKPSC